jgi:hypothetical protein
MVDWKQSLPQILASVIGSGLIVAALSTIGSLILKPILDISVVVQEPIRFEQQNVSYTVILRNIGYTPATNLRLTMSYPDASILHSVPHYVNENMTLKVENSTSTVLVFYLD